MAEGKIHSLNICKAKGEKLSVAEARLIENFGLESSMTAGNVAKQVGLVSWESIEKENGSSKVKKNAPCFKPGDFSEDITTEGIKLSDLNVGDKIVVGTDAVLEVSSIGKECHKYFAIHYKSGDCVMPDEGVVAKVLNGGHIKIGDTIKTVDVDEYLIKR